MNPLYLYQCLPLGQTGGSMHVLVLGELLCLLPPLPPLPILCLVAGIGHRESRMRHQTCQAHLSALFSFLHCAVLLDLPSAGLILSNPARTHLQSPWLQNPPILTTNLSLRLS